MPDFHTTHAALFDELERQGIYCVDVGKLTRAVFEAQTIIAQPLTLPRTTEPYRRCETYE